MEIVPESSAQAAPDMSGSGTSSPIVTVESVSVERPRTTTTAIFVSVVLLTMGFALQGTAIVLRAGLEGFSEIAIGVVSASNFAGMFAGSFLAMVVIREVGYVRVFASFASILSATAIAHVLVIGPIIWTILRFLSGICVSIIFVVVESWLNAITSNERRGRTMSLYGLLFLGSVGASQPLIGVFPPTTFEIFGITSIFTSLCLVPISLARVTGTPQISRLQIRILGLVRTSPLGTMGVLASGVVMGAHMSLGARFAQLRGLGDATIGLFLFTASLGTMAFQLPLGLMSDRWDRRSALVVATGAGSIAALAIAAAPPGSPMLFITTFLFGGFALPLYSLALATVNDQLQVDEMVEASSAIYVLYASGSIVGPLLASIGIARYGPGAMYVLNAVLLMAFAVGTLLRVRFVPEYRVRGRTARYRVFPRTTAMVYAMVRRGPKGEGRGSRDRG